MRRLDKVNLNVTVDSYKVKHKLSHKSNITMQDLRLIPLFYALAMLLYSTPIVYIN